MQNEEYARMYELEAFYWWFVARRKLLADCVREHLPESERPAIMDVGCGTGLNHTVLSRFGETYNMDVSELALDFCRKRGIHNLQAGSAEQITFPDEVFDVLTALDVLEHVD